MLHAGCSPGSCQAVCSPCMQSSPAGSLPICRQRAQSHSRSCKQHSTGPEAPCVAVLEHILQLCSPRRHQLNTSLHCRGDVGAAWPQGQTATVHLCPIAATGMGHLLLLRRGDRLGTALLSCQDWVPACQDPAATSSSRCSPWVGAPGSHRSPGRQSCPGGCSSRGIPCSGELSREHGTMTVREKPSFWEPS